MHIDNGRRRNPREPTHPGHRVIAVDLVPERIELARSRGIEVLDLTETDDVEAPRAYEMFRKKADGAIKIPVAALSVDRWRAWRARKAT